MAMDGSFNAMDELIVVLNTTSLLVDTAEPRGAGELPHVTVFAEEIAESHTGIGSTSEKISLVICLDIRAESVGKAADMAKRVDHALSANRGTLRRSGFLTLSLASVGPAIHFRIRTQRGYRDAWKKCLSYKAIYEQYPAPGA
jgi:hypothetical protein